MKRLRLVVFLVPFILFSGCGSDSERFSFQNVTVIDVTDGTVKPHMTVTITGDSITAVTPDGSEDKTRQGVTFYAAGKFVIPGLFDMHVHFAAEESNLLAFVANGVTFVRDMGSIVIDPGGPEGFTYRSREEMLNRILGTREKIANGILLGPEIVTPGVIMTGPLPPEAPFESPEFQWALTEEGETRAAARYLKNRGVDFLKVHTMPSREVYFAVADEAEKLGIPFAGHVPISVSAVEAVLSRQASIEHQTGVEEYMAAGETGKADERRAQLFDFYAENPSAWHCPTLVVSLGFEKARDLIDHPEREPRLAYICPELVAWWNTYWPPETYTGDDTAKTSTLEDKMAWVGEMRDRGIGIMAGTDFAALFVYPGFSLHDELVLLNRAGLSPLETLQTATINPARFLGLEKTHGTVEAGKRADLVLLEANPLEDIANTTKIAGVVVRGRYLSKADISDMLAEIRRDVARTGHRADQ